MPIAFLIAFVALLPVLASGYHSIAVEDQILFGSITVLLLANCFPWFSSARCLATKTS
jgi:hypothetical protein